MKRAREVSAILQSYAWLLPGLALRLAAPLAVFDSKSQTVIDEPTMAAALTITRALAHQHLAVVAAAQTPATTDATDRQRVMLQKITAQGPLTPGSYGGASINLAPRGSPRRWTRS